MNPKPFFTAMDAEVVLTELPSTSEVYKYINMDPSAVSLDVPGDDHLSQEAPPPPPPTGYAENPPDTLCKMIVCNGASECSSYIKEVYVIWTFTDGSKAYTKDLNAGLRYPQCGVWRNEDIKQCVLSAEVVTFVIINGYPAWPGVLITSKYPHLCLIEAGIKLNCGGPTPA